MELRLDGQGRAGHRRVARGSARPSPPRYAAAGAAGDDLVAQAGRPRGGGRRASTADGRRSSPPTPASPTRPRPASPPRVERFGGIDVLVNNAATNPYMGPIIDIDLARYDKTGQVNLRGPLVWTQARLARRPCRSTAASVVNIAVDRRHAGRDRHRHLQHDQGGRHPPHQQLAAELAPGVRVNAIAPGLVKTDMARALWEPHEEPIAGRMPARPPRRARRHRQRRAVPGQRRRLVDHRPHPGRRRRPC